MARQAGRFGRVYIDVAGGGNASPLPFVASWTAEFKVAFEDATALGDTNLIRLAGLPDAQGTFAGFYDDASAQTYTAAADGLARKMYLYPSLNNAGTYFFGTVFVDTSFSGGVTAPLGMSASWVAASTLAKVG